MRAIQDDIATHGRHAVELVADVNVGGSFGNAEEGACVFVCDLVPQRLLELEDGGAVVEEDAERRHADIVQVALEVPSPPPVEHGGAALSERMGVCFEDLHPPA